MLVREDGNVTGSLHVDLDKQAVDLARDSLTQGESRRVRLNEEVEVFVEVVLPPPTLIAVGGVHITIALMSLAKKAFQQIPITRSTAIAMLTHDPKLDDPALKIALPSPAFYIGALGSRTTQAKRRQRLLAEGVTEAQLDRLHGPIGLDIGAGTPEEIAMSIMAEIVAAQNAVISPHSKN
jgi:xanthine dehydrogenase accessory factor